jgi:hypothetical protein
MRVLVYTNAKKLNSFDYKNSQSGISQMQLFFEEKEIKKIIETK